MNKTYIFFSKNVSYFRCRMLNPTPSPGKRFHHHEQRTHWSILPLRSWLCLGRQEIYLLQVGNFFLVLTSVHQENAETCRIEIEKSVNFSHSFSLDALLFQTQSITKDNRQNRAYFMFFGYFRFGKWVKGTPTCKASHCPQPIRPVLGSVELIESEDFYM